MKKLNKQFLIFISKWYRFYLLHKWFRVLTWALVWIWALATKSLLLGIIKIAFIFLYRHFFIFPVRNSFVVNTVIGPPGSGKTSLAAFVSLKARLTLKDCAVYTNADILDTRVFDWEADYGTYDMQNCLIVLDESGLDLDNRNFAFNFADVVDKKTGKLLHNGRSKLLSLKYHRHLHQTLWVLSQWTDQDVKLRNLSQNFYVCKKTGFPWLLCVKLYDTDIDVDPLSGDFRFIRKKKHTYFIFSPVIWFDFSTLAVPFDLPSKEWSIYS